MAVRFVHRTESVFRGSDGGEDVLERQLVGGIWRVWSVERGEARQLGVCGQGVCMALVVGSGCLRRDFWGR